MINAVYIQFDQEVKLYIRTQHLVSSLWKQMREWY